MTDPVHTRPDAGLPALLSALGGRRNIVDGALPTVVFVAAHAAAGLVVGAPAALRAAVVAAAAAGLGATAVRIARGEPLAGALRGLVGLGVAVLVAACTGQARDFFLPGIYVDAAYGVVFAGPPSWGGHWSATCMRLCSGSARNGGGARGCEGSSPSPPSGGPVSSRCEPWHRGSCTHRAGRSCWRSASSSSAGR